MSSTNVIVVDHRYLGNIDTKFNKKWHTQSNLVDVWAIEWYFALVEACDSSLLLGTPQHKVWPR